MLHGKTDILINGAGKVGSYMQSTQLDCFLTSYTKINIKWIKGLNVRLEIIKLPEESIGIGLSNIILDMSLQARETNAKINKLDHIKLKSFCIVKEVVKNIYMIKRYT